MATVGTWKNSPFAPPLCSPITVHNAGKPDLAVVERCLCLKAGSIGGYDIEANCATIPCPNGLPLQWRITANVQNGGCCFNPLGCEQFSSWVMTAFEGSCGSSGPCGGGLGGVCCWRNNLSLFTQHCGGGGSGQNTTFCLEEIDIDGTDYYVLYTGAYSSSICGTDLVRYRIPVADFDCAGPNILVKYQHTFFPDPPCIWPDTILMEIEP